MSTKTYTYQDIIRLNERRKKEQNLSSNPDKIKTIYNLDIEKGQVITNLHVVDSIEHFLYEFLKKGFIIKNPEELSDYNFDNLRLYTNPEEFKKDLIGAINNAALFGIDFIFNSFILNLSNDDEIEITDYTDKSITVLIVPDFVTSIGNDVFMFTKLEAVKLPNGLKKIGNRAFYGCSELRKINFPKNLEHIGTESFCLTKLTEIKIPEKMTVIDYNSFAYTPLEKVIFPKGLKEIRSNAFYATSLRKLHIPSVEIIGRCAFGKCKLKGILRLPKNLKKCYVNSFPDDIVTIYIPKGVDYVGDRDFYNFRNIVEY